MKRFISLFLAVIMAISLCACGSANKDETKPTDKPNTEQTETQTPTEPNPEKPFEANYNKLENKYFMLSTYNLHGMTSEDVGKIETVDDINRVFSNISQTVIVFEYIDGWEYDSDSEECSFQTNESNEGAVTLVPYEEESIEELTDDLQLIKEKDFQNIDGAIYKYEEDEDVVYAYIGLVDEGAWLLAYASAESELEALLDSMEVIETENLEMVEEPKDEGLFVAKSDVVEVRTMLVFSGTDKYDTEEEDDGFVAISKDKKTGFEVEIEENYYYLDDLNDAMYDCLIDALYHIETDNFYGLILQGAEEIEFFGFDKNAFVSVHIIGKGTLNELFDFICNLDIQSEKYDESAFDDKQESWAQNDESAVGELALAVKYALTDIDIWESVQDCIKENPSCYVNNKEVETTGQKLSVGCSHGDKHYTYDATNRTDDEVIYELAGCMSGFTITFNPTDIEGERAYVLKDGIINLYSTEDDLHLDDFQYLYNRMRATIGNYVAIQSDKYENSPITIFVLIDGDVVYDAYCQFAGTNIQ